MIELKVHFKKTFGFSPGKKPVFVKPSKPRKQIKSEVKVPSRKSQRIADKDFPLGFYCDQNLDPVERKNSISKALVEHSVEVTMETSSMAEPAATSSPCPDCAKVFKHKNSLAKHMGAVHSGTRFRCDVCFSTFSYKANLKRHVALEHETNQSVHQCDECNRTFSYKHNLKFHINKFHKHEL